MALSSRIATETRHSAGFALAAAALTALVVVTAGGAEAGAQGVEPAQDRPNVVVVMSDDQTQDSIRYMPRVQEQIGAQGATFPQSFTNWPVCCPSRATFLTGQYAHNHQVLGNTPPLGGFERLDSSETLPVWLQRAGYYTAHIGKYLNGYEGSSVGVPAGWSEWHGSKETYTFYGYTLLEGGQLVEYGADGENPDDPANPASYQTDVYTDKAVELIGRRAAEDQPFFLSLAYLAPHSGGPNPDPPTSCDQSAKPAPRHLTAFDAEPLPQSPNFNEADVTDKPSGIASRPALTPNQITRATRFYRCRAESLLAIDEGVERIVNALRATGELDDTLVVYTSDNGFFHGEHRILTGKNRVYEEAIRVPLLIRGPGIDKGVEVDDLAVNADLAPTILDVASAEAGRTLDGRSLIDLAEHPSRLRGREILIEQDVPDDEQAQGVEYDAIRTARYVYVENVTGEIELYDLELDPYQLTNLHANPAYAAAEAALASRLASLRGCAGASCRRKPSVNLKLPPSVREEGRSCRRAGDFLARLRGRALGDVIEATFRVGSRLADRDSRAPFKERLRPKLLRRSPRPEVRVIVELVDGRLVSAQKRVRICG